jgi:hypothetical protein
LELVTGDEPDWHLIFPNGADLNLTLGKNVLLKPTADANTWGSYTWESITIASAPEKKFVIRIIRKYLNSNEWLTYRGMVCRVLFLFV